jgi:hypothetical protein
MCRVIPGLRVLVPAGLGIGPTGATQSQTHTDLDSRRDTHKLRPSVGNMKTRNASGLKLRGLSSRTLASTVAFFGPAGPGRGALGVHQTIRPSVRWAAAAHPASMLHGEAPPPIAARSRWSRCHARGAYLPYTSVSSSPSLTTPYQLHSDMTKAVIVKGEKQSCSTRWSSVSPV